MLLPNFQLKDEKQINRVKSLSKSGNAKKDQVASSVPPTNKDSISASSFPVSADVEDVYEQHQELKAIETGRKFVDKENLSYNPSESNKQPSSFPSNYPFNGREDVGVTSGTIERQRVDKQNFGGSTSQLNLSSYPQNSVDTEERVQKVSPPRRKTQRDEKSEKLGNWLKKDGSGSDFSTTSYKQQSMSSFTSNNIGSRKHEPEQPPPDGNIKELLEVGYKLRLFIRLVIALQLSQCGLNLFILFCLFRRKRP